ncbi:MAG: tetratricopeptide repeat protein [Chloroflexi bacterium]|nr:tetratricopeptide repeat protein [Chloroflexota bacterium]
MANSNIHAGGDLDLSVSGDFVGGDKIVNIQNIYQGTAEIRPTPRLAPPAPSPFIGRSALLFDCLAAIQERPNTADTPQLIILTGMAGVGKSALAAAVVNDPLLVEEFSDGTLWTELGPTADPLSTLANWGDQFGADLAGYATAETRSRALRSLIHNKKLLIVLDDVWEAASAVPFLVASPSSCVIITTRRGNLGTELGGSYTHLTVVPLNDADSLTLLQQFIPQAVQADRAGAIALVKRMGGLPIGIALAGQMMAREWQAGLGFANALAELNERETRLGLNRGGSKGAGSMRLMLAVSYDHLPGDHERRAFRQLAIFGSKPRSFGIETAAYLWQLESRPAQRMMVALVNQQMVEPLGDGRFTLHSTLADFGQSLLEEKKELEALRQRHMNYYLQWVQKRTSADWHLISQDLEQLRVAFQTAVAGTDTQPIIQFLLAMNSYFARRGLWQDWRTWTETTLNVIPAKDLSLRGVLSSNLGAIYHKQENFDQALEAYQQARQVLEKTADHATLAVVLNNMGAIYARLQLGDEALEVYEQAQELLEEAADHASQAALATTLNNIGMLHGRQQAWAQAFEYHQLSYDFYHALGEKMGLATTLTHMGTLADRQGHTAEALAYFARGHQIYAELGDLMGESTALYNMALLCQQAGDKPTAAQHMARVVEIDEQLNLPDIQADKALLAELLN